MLDMALVRQLNDPDVNKRKQAITGLAKSKNAEALSYLAAVYQNDKNKEVRELARKAGIYIKNQENKRSVVNDYDDDDAGSTGTRAAYYEEETNSGLTQDVDVSPLDEERAAGLVKQALDIHMRGDNARAARYLRDALKKNPNLIRDSYTAGLAATITGTDSTRAIRLIMSESYEQEKSKRGKSKNSSGEATWGDAIVDLVIYLLVNAGLFALFLLAIVGLFLPSISQTLATPTATSPGLSPVDINLILQSLTGIGFALIALYSGIVGVISTILLLIQYVFIHMISVGVLAGEGSFTRLITKVTLPMTFAYPLSYLAVFGINLLSLQNPDSAGITYIIQIVINIGVFSLFCHRVGLAYRFGSNKGCAAIVLSFVAMVLVACACSFILPSVMVSLNGGGRP